MIVGIGKIPSHASRKLIKVAPFDKSMYIHISDVKDGKLASLRGWAYRVRKQKDMIFIILRDSTGTIQCVVKKDSKAFKEAEKLTTESSLQLRGIAKKDARAPTGYEVQVKELEIVGLAEPYPIARDLSEEFLLDVRHLSLRMPRYQAIMRIRSKVFEATHEYLRKLGYLECHPPMFVQMGSEGGSTQFDLKYFDKKAQLSQSWQMHAETMVQALERVYYIGPSFRAEKSRTRRHVTEFWHCEIEAAWVLLEEIMKTGEELIAHVCQRVAKECKAELKSLSVDATKLMIKAPFKRLTYDQAVKKLKCRYGIDFGVKEERKLTEGMSAPLTITHFPKKIMPFYKRKYKKDLTLSFSVLCPGLGETIDGSEREPDLKEIIKSAKAQKIDPKELGFYLDTRRYGAVPHSGFGLGMARLIMWICGLDSIRDAIPFPRTPTRCYP